MRTTMTAIAAAGALALATVSMPTTADAYCRGCGVGLGIAGGLVAGAIIGGAIANSALSCLCGRAGLCTVSRLRSAGSGRLPRRLLGAAPADGSMGQRSRLLPAAFLLPMI